MHIQGIRHQQQSTQTQQISSSSFIPQTQHLLTLPKQFFFQQFALYCTSRGKNSPITNYQTHQLPIKIISTMQQFFQYFLSIKTPSQLPYNSKIMLFYKNSKPFWQQWLDSGCLLIKLKDNKQQQQHLLDIIWQFLCYSIVANNLDIDIIGVSLCKKEKISVIEIWLRGNDRAVQIGVTLIQQIKKQLPASLLSSINSILKIKHKRHIDSINTNSTIKGAQDLTELKIRHKTELNNSF